MPRPKANIDWKIVDQLLEASCEGTEIAAYIGIDNDTLYKRCKTDNKMCFSEYLQQKKAKGDSMLKTKQFKIAMEGDKAMLIWLGKQRLGQKDRHDHTSNDKELKVLTITEREARIKEIKEKLGIKEDE
ncbi:MAG: hypothetical protein OEV44_00220 [Spirochaetota bacterium]|nr:hypothetical protein [Spirochaetota bacterium]